MRSTQRRLLGYGRSTRPYVALASGLGLLSAVLLVVQAGLLAHAVTAAFIGHQGPARLWPTLAWLPAVALARGGLAWAQELAGHQVAADVKTRLRLEVAERVLELGPGRLAGERTGELANTLAAGVEALDAYYSRYLPQLVLAVAVPVLVIAWTVPQDWVSAAIMLVTVPLIPVFMALVGLAARARTERQWRALSVLSAHFLDVVQGLPTLRVFGRARAQAETVRAVTDRYRLATMDALRVAFLSSLVMELVATLSTALVAVGIGIRLDRGGLGLEAGLAILVLTPEVYLPLRRLGAQFHAGIEALAPAGRLFELLDGARPAGSGSHVPDLRLDPIRVRGLAVRHPERGMVLEGFSLDLEPGEKVALVGPSGAGKTTVIGCLLGFLAPERGSIRVGGVPYAELSREALLCQMAWVPQRPHLFNGSIKANIRVGDPDAGPAAVRRAASEAGLELPLETEVGERGASISAGQRQRVALARALLREAPLLVLDEPAANLDLAAQEDVARLLRRLRGTTVLFAAHSPALAAAADRVVRL